MLWNWNVVDSCFLSSQWQITGNGMLAGSCVGIIFLVILLEALRRMTKEYDRYLIRMNAEKHVAIATAVVPENNIRLQEAKTRALDLIRPHLQMTGLDEVQDADRDALLQAAAHIAFRPTTWNQIYRAMLHTTIFAIGYILMLLAMYYNGFVIISIFMGAYLGSFFFSWEVLSASHLPPTLGAEARACFKAVRKFIKHPCGTPDEFQGLPQVQPQELQPVQPQVSPQVQPQGPPQVKQPHALAQAHPQELPPMHPQGLAEV